MPHLQNALLTQEAAPIKVAMVDRLIRMQTGSWHSKYDKFPVPIHRAIVTKLIFAYRMRLQSSFAFLDSNSTYGNCWQVNNSLFDSIFQHRILISFV